MNNLSRRRFLGWSSAATGSAALLALAPRLAARISTPEAPGASTSATPLTAEPIVAYASNPASGQLSLMVGTSEVVVNDPDLVARMHQLLTRSR